MDKNLDYFREMIALRGPTDDTLTSYCTYIKSYLNYLTDTLHKSPEDVSQNELRDYMHLLQKSRALSNRTINCIISQLRFLTLLVLHGSIDDMGVTCYMYCFLYFRKDATMAFLTII